MPRFETRLTPELVERYTRSGHWGTESFYATLARRAAAHPDRVAIVDAKGPVTYGELLARVDRVAAGLQALGVGPGNVVTIQMPNWAEFAYAFFACERVGAVANQVGPDYRSREVDYILRFSESRVFVCPASFKGFDYVAMIQGLRSGLPDLKVVCVLGGGEGTVRLDDMITDSRALTSFKPHLMGASEVMRIAFTSGTTGNPKGVTHSFNTTLPTCRILNEAMQVTENEGRPRAEAIQQDRAAAERERVTLIPTAPASIIAMLNDRELERFDFRSLRVVITGGASCPVHAAAHRMHVTALRMGRCGRRDSMVRVESDKETAWDSSLEDENEDVCGVLGWRQLNGLNAPADLL